jgi:hypothetical protein
MRNWLGRFAAGRSRVRGRLGRPDSPLAIAEASIRVSMPRTKAQQHQIQGKRLNYYHSSELLRQ